MMNEKEKKEEKIASNQKLAIERAKELKKEDKKEEKKEEKNQIIQKAIQNESKMNKWGDLFFSDARKAFEANQIKMQEEAEYIFEIDAEKKEISFRLKESEDKIDDKSFLIFFKSRCKNRFFFRKDAKQKLKNIFAIDAEEMRFRIEFEKESKGKLYLLN